MVRLSKIGINDLSSAILFIPKSYTNAFVIKNLARDALLEGVLRIRILRAQTFPRVMKIDALMLDFNERLDIAIFNAKSYHRAVFAPNKEMHILGKFVYDGIWRTTQPKITTQINTIIMNFPATKMTNANLNAIFREIMNLDSIRALGLSGEHAKNIHTIFHPENDLNYVSEFARNGGLFGQYLESVKLLEILSYIKSLRAKKHEFLATHELKGNHADFVASLPFKLTSGQSDCISALSAKLHSQKATRCVVMGDVGCGKTIVILACVMMAYPLKSVLLAPTTILAKQLFGEANKFLPKFVRVGLMMKNNALPDCDFLIGTHSLLYEDLRDFALFMTDEQHRFGTTQRQKIEQMLSIEGKKPHSVQFSATPIPRTMALIESNLVDFCFINDLPFKKDIDTKIITNSDFSALLEHINQTISRGEQVAIIYPLVEQSDAIDYQSIQEGLPFWQRRFEGVFSTHGKDKQKEEIIDAFAQNGKILVATTLFEVGMSLPKLSTIIIVGAERLGFATLHQLRGRVSRNGLKGHCFLFTKKQDSPRLADFVQTTNGFEIAELDLRYRNSGDILGGIRQSGAQFKYFDISADKKLVLEAQEKLDS